MRAAALMLLMAAVLLAGCSSTSTDHGELPAEEVSQMRIEAVQFPDGVDRYDAEALSDVVTVSGGELFLVLHGSSSCPPDTEVAGASAEGGVLTELFLEPADYSGQACTTDYAAHHYQLISEYEVAEDVEVSVLDGAGDAEALRVVDSAVSGIPPSGPGVVE